MARFYWLALFSLGLLSLELGAYPLPAKRYSNEYGVYFSTPALACSDWGTRRYGSSFISCEGAMPILTVNFKNSNGTLSVTYTRIYESSNVDTCLPNSSFDSGFCVCGSGYRDTGSSCEARDADSDLAEYCSQFKNSRREAAVSQSGRDDPYTGFSSTCRVPQAYSPDGGSTGVPMFPGTNKGCAADFEYSWAGSDGNRNWTIYGYEITTGGTCMPGSSEGGSGGSEGGTGDDGEAPVTNDPNKFCDGYQGTVNGVSTCVPYASKTGSDGTSKTTNPDGTTEEKKTETTCSGTKCTTTTTTTTTDSSGNVTGVTVTVGDSTKDVYCDKNPKAAICKGDGDGEDGASFAGSCTTEFTCKGDVLQCVIAKEQHKRACQLIDNEYDETKLYESSKGKTGDQTLELPGNRILDMNGPGMFKTDAIFGSGSCIQDLDVQVMDRTVQLPLSYLCPWVAELRYVLLGLGGLYWVMIVFGRR